jgi:2-dehydro-3-deoxyphosphogluconate aldolase/(4S)-4-hydroxy-2-oxoglutarate aldolase
MLKELAAFGVIPVIAVETVNDGLHVCEALQNGGLPLAEITFRTKAAAEVIREVSRRFPEMKVGAGTLLTVADLKRAVDAGAVFGVAPGCNPTGVSAAVNEGFPFAPGVCTPSDIERAVEIGVRDLKFFPAEAAGGLPMLKALIGPYGHLGLNFCTTGGIKPENMLDYLALPQVPVVGGTWLAAKATIADQDWAAITAAARNASELVGGRKKA